MGDLAVTQPPLFHTTPPAIKYATKGVPPPSALYIGPDERLYVETYSAVAGNLITILVRLLLPNGTIQLNEFRHYTTGGRAVTPSNFTLAEGFLLSVVVTTTALDLRRGACWCQVSLVRGEGPALIRLQAIMANYVTSTGPLAWPGGQLLSSTDGPGWVRTFQGTDPGAGSPWAETVPGNAAWRLINAWCVLSTDATAGSRQVQFDIVDPLYPVCRVKPNYQQTASLFVSYQFSAGFPLASAVANNVLCPLPSHLVLPEGYRIGASYNIVGAADDWLTPVLTVEEWIQT